MTKNLKLRTLPNGREFYSSDDGLTGETKLYHDLKCGSIDGIKDFMFDSSQNKKGLTAVTVWVKQ